VQVSVTDRVREVVAPICTDLGLEIYDVEHASGKVRVTVERTGGVDLEALAVATRLISRELDERDPVPGRYQLEVSSPGLERPLRTPAHFQRAVGASVSIRLQPGVEGERRVVGVLVAADDDAATVEVADGAPGEVEPGRRQVRYADVERARTTFAWGPPPKPGKGPRTGRSPSAREEEEMA
jgi:ribosome maturation factor RimP